MRGASKNKRRTPCSWARFGSGERNDEDEDEDGFNEEDGGPEGDTRDGHPFSVVSGGVGVDLVDGDAAQRDRDDGQHRRNARADAHEDAAHHEDAQDACDKRNDAQRMVRGTGRGCIGDGEGGIKRLLGRRCNVRGISRAGIQ